MNPLLDIEGLPHFSKIRVEHIDEALEVALKEAKHASHEILASDSSSFNEFFLAMSLIGENLHKVWGPIDHLNAVVNTPQLREKYNEWIPKISRFELEIKQDERYFKKLKQLVLSDEYKKLGSAEKHMIDLSYRTLIREGAELKDEDKKRFKEIKEELSFLGVTFSNNVLDETQGYEFFLKSDEDLEGLPQSAISFLRQQAKESGRDGWRATLDAPSFVPFMQYSKRRDLREKIYKAYIQRASKGDKDNTEIMFRMLELRFEKAKLLGYDDFSAYSLDVKMAKDPNKVVSFLEELFSKSIGKARKEYEELKAFSKKDGLDDFEPWDSAYYSEKLLQEKYAFSSEDLREYFPVSVVIQGLFEVIKRLFSVELSKEEGIEVWHKDVEYYSFKKDSKTIAGVYFDLYARRGKRQGAWMNEVIGRKKKKDGSIQLPVAYLNCNFTPPSDGRESLLTHDEVCTLFHEMGHVLHHSLTKVDYNDISGVSGVPWDAVELPSQFMENWCWEEESLRLMSKHHQTGKEIPKELLSKMIAAKNFHSAMFLAARQVNYGLIDMHIHRRKPYENKEAMQKHIREIKTKYNVREPLQEDRFENAFLHIFSGGSDETYAAGYYSYKWAEVLSSDCFMPFKERGIFNREIAASFYESILSKGGGGDFMTFFVDFMKREPKIDALLNLTGVVDD